MTNEQILKVIDTAPYAWGISAPAMFICALYIIAGISNLRKKSSTYKQNR